MKILMFGGIKNNLDQILRNQVWSWYYPDSLNKVFFPFFFFSLSPNFCPFQPPSPNPNTTWSSQKMDRSSLPLIWGWRELYIYRMGKKRQSLFDSNSSFSCAGSSEGGVIHWGKGHKIKKRVQWSNIHYVVVGLTGHILPSYQLLILQQSMPLGVGKSVRWTAGTCEPQHSETWSAVIYTVTIHLTVAER